MTNFKEVRYCSFALCLLVWVAAPDVWAGQGEKLDPDVINITGFRDKYRNLKPAPVREKGIEILSELAKEGLKNAVLDKGREDEVLIGADLVTRDIRVDADFDPDSFDIYQRDQYSVIAVVSLEKSVGPRIARGSNASENRRKAFLNKLITAMKDGTYKIDGQPLYGLYLLASGDENLFVSFLPSHEAVARAVFEERKTTLNSKIAEVEKKLTDAKAKETEARDKVAKATKERDAARKLAKEAAEAAGGVSDSETLAERVRQAESALTTARQAATEATAKVSELDGQLETAKKTLAATTDEAEKVKKEAELKQMQEKLDEARKAETETKEKAAEADTAKTSAEKAQTDAEKARTAKQAADEALRKAEEAAATATQEAESASSEASELATQLEDAKEALKGFEVAKGEEHESVRAAREKDALTKTREKAERDEFQRILDLRVTTGKAIESARAAEEASRTAEQKAEKEADEARAERDAATSQTARAEAAEKEAEAARSMAAEVAKQLDLVDEQITQAKAAMALTIDAVKQEELSERLLEAEARKKNLLERATSTGDRADEASDAQTGALTAEKTRLEARKAREDAEALEQASRETEAKPSESRRKRSDTEAPDVVAEVDEEVDAAKASADRITVQIEQLDIQISSAEKELANTLGEAEKKTLQKLIEQAKERLTEAREKNAEVEQALEGLMAVRQAAIDAETVRVKAVAQAAKTAQADARKAEEAARRAEAVALKQADEASAEAADATSQAARAAAAGKEVAAAKTAVEQVDTQITELDKQIAQARKELALLTEDEARTALDAAIRDAETRKADAEKRKVQAEARVTAAAKAQNLAQDAEKRRVAKEASAHEARAEAHKAEEIAKAAERVAMRQADAARTEQDTAASQTSRAEAATREAQAAQAIAEQAAEQVAQLDIQIEQARIEIELTEGLDDRTALEQRLQEIESRRTAASQRAEAARHRAEEASAAHDTALEAERTRQAAQFARLEAERHEQAAVTAERAAAGEADKAAEQRAHAVIPLATREAAAVQSLVDELGVQIEQLETQLDQAREELTLTLGEGERARLQQAMQRAEQRLAEARQRETEARHRGQGLAEVLASAVDVEGVRASAEANAREIRLQAREAEDESLAAERLARQRADTARAAREAAERYLDQAQEAEHEANAARLLNQETMAQVAQLEKQIEAAEKESNASLDSDHQHMLATYIEDAMARLQAARGRASEALHRVDSATAARMAALRFEEQRATQAEQAARYALSVAKLMQAGRQAFAEAGVALGALDRIIVANALPLGVAVHDAGTLLPADANEYLVLSAEPGAQPSLQRLRRSAPAEGSEATGENRVYESVRDNALLGADAAGAEDDEKYLILSVESGARSSLRRLRRAVPSEGETAPGDDASMQSDKARDKVVETLYGLTRNDEAPGGVSIVRYLPQATYDKVTAAVQAGKALLDALAEVDAEAAQVRLREQQAIAAAERAAAAAMAPLKGLQNPALRRQAYADSLGYMGRAATRFDDLLFDELSLEALQQGDSRQWVGILSAAGSISGTGMQKDSKENSQGLAAGSLYQLSDHFTLGVGLAQSAGKVSSDGKASLDLTQLGLMGRHAFDGGHYLAVGAGLAHAVIDTKRNHDEVSAKGETSITQYHASTRVGSSVELGEWIFAPSIALMLRQTELQGTREEQSGLHVRSQRQNSSQATTGLNLSRSFQLDGWLLRPELSAEYRRLLGSLDSVRVEYAGDTWRQPGASRKRGSGGFGLGLEVRRSIARARAEIGDDGTVNLKFGVSW